MPKKNENFKLKRAAQLNSQNLINTNTQSRGYIEPNVYGGTHSHVNQTFVSSNISQNPVLNNNMYTQRQSLSNIYPHNTLQESNYSPNTVQNSRYIENQDPNSNLSQYPVQNRDFQQYQSITEPNLLKMQHYSEPRYINTSEVHRVNDNGRRTRVPFYNGKDPWNAYVMQFEQIAEMNNWTPLTKAIELVTALNNALCLISYNRDKEIIFSTLCSHVK